MVFPKLCSSFEQHWKLHKLLCLDIGNYSECAALSAAAALMLSPSGIGNCNWDACSKLLQRALKFLPGKCLTIGLAKCVITASFAGKALPIPHPTGMVLCPTLSSMGLQGPAPLFMSIKKVAMSNY